MKADIKLKRVHDVQCALVFTDQPGPLDTMEKNTSLEAELRQKSGLEDCNQSLSLELNKKCKKSESLKAANALLMEQIDLHFPPAIPISLPTLILRKKLVNAEQRMKSLKVNNSEWEVWHQALKKALASEGYGRHGGPNL
ncbi:hypothetical protein GIB67_009102 [Kingdonia uniflora]|uniref:Uncharacterized protein n=1 Tax=Kingdonia uniflora TaxID=39325 RepID=A0A7J7N3M4_9MAGN|nr:hypothetical protein GIB67_009102 [Kingdonia uniflora]